MSRATRPNERWAIDATHIFSGRDGGCHLTAIIDCYDRNIVGWRLSKTGVAKVVAAALEEALRLREIDPENNDLILRSDNGLVFGAKPFVAIANRYGLDQEYITPDTPEQIGMIGRFFGSLKTECLWLHRFRDRDHAFGVIATWIDHYHGQRPHQALGYLTPDEYREKLAAWLSENRGNTTTWPTAAFARARSSVSVTSDAFIVVPSVHTRMYRE